MCFLSYNIIYTHLIFNLEDHLMDIFVYYIYSYNINYNGINCQHNHPLLVNATKMLFNRNLIQKTYWK